MTEQTPPVPDPFAMWREWVTESERQWNVLLNEARATDQFSRSMGRLMELYLNMQKSMSEVMGRYFTALNVPTRADVLALGDRLLAIEDRLTNIEARLAPPATDELGGAPAPTVPRPPRTKKPTRS